MIHGHNAIKVLAFEEYGVAGEGTLYVYAGKLGGEDSGVDAVDLLTAEGAGLAVVGVQGADC